MTDIIYTEQEGEMTDDIRNCFSLLGLRREGEDRKGKVWDGAKCSCGSRLTHDDGTGFTCVDCGLWKAGGAGFYRVSGVR